MINYNRYKTDAAWQRLHNRLEREGLISEKREKIRFYKSPAFGIAATIILFVVVSLYLLVPTKPQSSFISLIGDQEGATTVMTLEEGSTIYLSNSSVVEYPSTFSKRGREVRLKGDAFFEISRAEESPFKIETEIFTIHVLGTSFNVCTYDKSGAYVSVRSGQVLVTLNESGKSQITNAGEIVFIENNNLIVQQADNLEQYHPNFAKLHFKDQKLSDVIRVINKTNQSARIVVIPELQNRIITATFSPESPETVAKMVCLALNLRYTLTEQEITIHN